MSFRTIVIATDGREERFPGLLLAEMEQTGGERDVTHRVYRTPAAKFVVHQERPEADVNTGPNAARWSTGWRAWIGDWSAGQSWTHLAADSTVLVADDLDDLRTLVPLRLYELVRDAVDQPTARNISI